MPTAITVVTLAHCVLGCGNFDGQGDDDTCDGGKCDGQGEFARPVVKPSSPLALTNTQQERITWPIWGTAFEIEDGMRARVVLEPTGTAGIVVAMAGDPEERRAFEMIWNGAEWTLAETVGGGAAVQEVSLGEAFVGPVFLEISDRGNTVVVRDEGRERGTLTASEAAEGPMGFYVQLEPGAQLSIGELGLTQPVRGQPDLGEPLKMLAGARGRALGSTSETGEWPPRHDVAFEAMYAGQFDTAGILDFYWTTTRGEDEDFHFLPADLMVNYASVRGQTINGYFLVWDEELPEWVNELAEAEGAEGLGAMLDHHIETIVGRYRGRVTTWIVANESFLGPDENGTGEADYADSVWYGTLGPEFIERAFRVADAADPDATLIYNETGAEALGAKSDFMYARMAELKSSGVPIDAVGLQFHIDAASPPDMTSVKRNMERFGALGLDVLITELDVNLANLPGTHAQRLAKQAELFDAVARTCLAVPACKTITLFGFSDKHAWDELGPEVCKPEGSTGLCSEPLIFTRAYEPKPAYHALRAALAE